MLILININIKTETPLGRKFIVISIKPNKKTLVLGIATLFLPLLFLLLFLRNILVHILPLHLHRLVQDGLYLVLCQKPIDGMSGLISFAHLLLLLIDLQEV